MKSRILIFLALMSGFAQLWGKPEIKQRDSYAYTRGVEAYNEGNYADALEWFKKELSEHPDNGYANIYESAILYNVQEYGRALSAIDNALKRLPKKDKEWRSGAFGARAEVFVAMGDTVRALNDLAQAIEIDSTNPSFYNKRGELNYSLGNYALSDADYQKMISLDQGDIIGYMGIGRNAKSQQRWDDAIKKFDYVIKLAPDYSSGYSFRAESYMGQEKWAEAADDIVKALDIDGDDKAFMHMQEFPKEAMGLLRTKLKIQMTKDPTNGYWPYCLAVVAKNNEDFDDAILYYEKANSLDANSVFMEEIAKCYQSKEDYVRALDYAERALAMSPEDYDVINLKANILSNLGRFDESLAERDRYVARYPEYCIAYLSRAEDLLAARRFNEAADDYDTAVVLVPSLADYPYLLMRRGDAYRLAGKKGEAEKDYERLLQAEKDSVLTANSWTPFAYSGLGNSEKAIETMQYILETDTTDIAGTLYNAACVYARLGKTSESLIYLKEAIEKGYHKFLHVRTDYDMDILRELPEYRELLNNELPEEESKEDGNQSAQDHYTIETVEVPFTKESGVTKVKCTINDLPLYFVFDTGAADVTMSMVEANFMLKNEYIKPTDITGSARYMDANGDITEGTVVNLRKVNFGGLELDNVRASIVRNQKAPLLLGQSVLGRLGRIEIDNENMQLKIAHKIKK